MRPNQKTQQRNSPDGIDHRCSTKNGSLGHGRKYFREYTEGWQDHHIDSRMRVEPEQMLV